MTNFLSKIFLYLVVLTGSVSATNNDRGEVADIRTGFHDSYSRIVIEGFTRFEYRISKDFKLNALVIDMEGKINPFRFGEIEVDPQDRFLRSVRYRQVGASTRVTVLVHSMDISVRNYELHGPFRIVIDVSPEYFAKGQQDANKFVATAAKSTRTSTDESVSQEPEPADSVITTLAQAIATVQDTLKPVSVVQDTIPKPEETFARLSETIFPSLKPEIPTEEPDQAGPQHRLVSEDTKRFLIIGLVFVIFDVFVWILYLKRRRKKALSRGAKRHAKATTRPDIVSAEFKNMLNTALLTENQSGGEKKTVEERTAVRDNILNDVSMISANLARDEIVGALSANLKRDLPQMNRPMPENIESIAAASGLTREELIGKDGKAFVKSLKQLALN